MSTPEITPEILRAVADEAHERSTLLNAAAVGDLRRWASRLEREQADEKRIDELAQVFYLASASNDDVPDLLLWNELSETARADRRAGVRAVLAAYDPEGRLTAPQERNGGWPNHPEAEALIGRTHAIDIELGGHGPDVSIDRFGDPVYPEQDAPVHPRTWDDLRDVPDKVRWVRDKDGDEIVRDAKRPYGWKWLHLGTSVGATEQCMTDYAPYTEIAEP